MQHSSFSKLKNILILIIFKKGVEIEKMHFYNKVFGLNMLLTFEIMKFQNVSLTKELFIFNVLKRMNA
jgi:hypothetical protein